MLYLCFFLFISDDSTNVSRIPRRTAISTTGNTPSSSRHNSVSGKRLSVNGSSSRPRTPTGLVSPASGVPARFVSILSVSQYVHLKKEIWKFTCGQLTRILSNLNGFVASSILIVERYILTTIVCIMSYFTFRIPVILEWCWSTCRVQEYGVHFPDILFHLLSFCFSFSFLSLFFIILSYFYFFFNYLFTDKRKLRMVQRKKKPWF